MFDNTKPNIILLSDYGTSLGLPKSLGVFKVASELRSAGYEVGVLFHLHTFSIEELCYILSTIVSDKTLFVGFNNIFYNTEKGYTNFDFLDSTHYEPFFSVWEAPEIGTMLPHGKQYNKQIKQVIKEKNPTCKLVFGGPAAYDHSGFKDYDYLVLGYSDISAINLADHLLKNTTLNKAYKSINGFTVINDAEAVDFDFSHSLMKYEQHDCVLPGETLPLETARGCIFSCAFCSYPLNGKKKLDFLKDTNYLYRELLDNYEKFGVTRYIMMDDTFNDSLEKINLMYEISKRLPFQIEYYANLRLDLLTAHEGTFDLLYASGLRHCFFGIESFNKKTAELIGKGMARERLIDTLTKIKNTYGDEVTRVGSFIFGLPQESIESMKMTGDFLLEQDVFTRWELAPFRLGTGNKDAGFHSKITKNPEKYGYKNLKYIELKSDYKRNININYWENEYTNWFEVQKLSNYYAEQYNNLTNKKLSDWHYLNVIGLNNDKKVLPYLKENNKISEINWLYIALLKYKRANEYKELFYKLFKIPKSYF